MVKNRNMFEQLRHATASGAGPASYDSGDRPTLAFNDLRIVDSIADIQMQASGGFIAEPVSVSGNIVTFRVRSPTNEHTHAFTGSLLATHQHDITVAGGAAAAGTDGLSIKASVLNKEASGADTASNAVDAASGGTPAGSNADADAAAGAEVADGTVLSGVTFYATAVGYA